MHHPYNSSWDWDWDAFEHPPAAHASTSSSAGAGTANTAHNQAKGKNSPSARIDAFRPHFQEILSDMFWKDHDDDVQGTCPTPGCPHPCTVKCRECPGREPTCTSCALRQHRNLPLHWLSVWNGDYFQRRDLAYFGFIIHLGHHGDPCPNIPVGEPAIKFVIVHDNGIHSCLLHYCHCPGRRSRLSQLVRADLFPATLDRIETAFTCQVLERFHLDFDVSKRSTQDFIRILEQLSPNEEPTAAAKDRYRDFLLAARIYRYLTIYKRAGIRHCICIPGRDGGTITVPCLTCPIPGFNLPDDWLDTPEWLRYLYRLILCADGNYSLQKKSKPSDEYDVALTTGEAFFVPEHMMQDFIQEKYGNKGASPANLPKDVGITCTGFKVARAQRTGKFRHVDNSGIVAFMCDHIFFRPGAVVDLYTTETWRQVDYALAGALKGTEELLERGASYDVVCSYICHLLERFAKSHPNLLPMVQDLKMLLPKLHMHAHQEMCQIVYAFCYARGFGLTHGEGVETPWSELNIAGLSTREMTAGARHDALNSLFNYWNWRKTCNMPRFLGRKLEEAYAAQRRTTRYFASLTGLAGAATVRAWLTVPVDDEAPTPQTFRAKTKSYTSSVYMWNRAELPNVETALQEILGGKKSQRRTHKQAAGAHLKNSAAMFIKNAIDLEQELLHLRYVHERRVQKQTVIADGFDGRVTWQSFHEKLRTWQKAQRKHMASCDEEYDELQDYTFDADDTEDPDYEPCPDGLGLPSDYTRNEREDYSLQTLADYERIMRIGLAFDQLDAIRLAVKHRAAHIEDKRKHARGGRANAAAQEEIQRTEMRARVLAARYNHNFERINLLRPIDYDGVADDTPGARLQSIQADSDLAIANIAAARTLHDSQRSGSWIWNVYEKAHSTNTRSGRTAAGTTASTVDFVQWQRAKAEKDRADEAVNRLCAEFRRTSKGFRAYGALWRDSAKTRQGGERAYAMKTAAMWTQMALRADKEYEVARRPDAPADKLDHTRSLRPYLEQLCGEDVEQFEDILAAWRMPPET